MNLDPRLDKLELIASQRTFNEIAVWDRDNSFVLAGLRVNVGEMMFLIVKVVHQNNHALEHRYDWHRVDYTLVV